MSDRTIQTKLRNITFFAGKNKQNNAYLSKSLNFFIMFLVLYEVVIRLKRCVMRFSFKRIDYFFHKMYESIFNCKNKVPPPVREGFGTAVFIFENTETQKYRINIICGKKNGKKRTSTLFFCLVEKKACTKAGFFF